MAVFLFIKIDTLAILKHERMLTSTQHLIYVFVPRFLHIFVSVHGVFVSEVVAKMAVTSKVTHRMLTWYTPV